MTVEELRQYRTIIKTITDLKERIEKEEEKEVDVVPGTVMASMHGFPYLETRKGIWMHDPEWIEKRNRQLARYQAELSEAERRKELIEEFINNIPDAELKLIFRHTFMDKKKQREVANLLNIDQSRISRKINDYLKNA